MKIQSGWLIITAVLVGIIIFLSTCHKKPEPCSTTHDTIIKFDSVVHTILVPKPYPVNHTYNHSDTFLQSVDSGAILHDYFTTYYYSQTLSDTNLRATITDTVTENKIQARGFNYQILRPETTIINTTTPIVSKNKVFIGLQIGTDKDFNPSLAPQLSFLNKNDKLFSIGYDVLNQSYQVTLSTKIKLKK